MRWRREIVPPSSKTTPRMRAKARSTIQPRARSSASAGYEGVAEFSGRGGGRDNAVQIAAEPRYANSCGGRLRGRTSTSPPIPRARASPSAGLDCVRASARNRCPSTSHGRLHCAHQEPAVLSMPLAALRTLRRHARTDNRGMIKPVCPHETLRQLSVRQRSADGAAWGSITSLASEDERA